MAKQILLQKAKQLFGWNRQPDKKMRLTVSFMLNTKVSKFNKKTDYKYMISFFFLFYPYPYKLHNTKISIKKFSCV